MAFGCSRWREGCTFVVPKIIASQVVTDRQMRELVAHHRQPEFNNIIRQSRSRRFLCGSQFRFRLPPALELRATELVLVRALSEQHLRPQRLERVAAPEPVHHPGQAVQALGGIGSPRTSRRVSTTNFKHLGREDRPHSAIDDKSHAGCTSAGP
jgi:hypothetical protein